MAGGKSRKKYLSSEKEVPQTKTVNSSRRMPRLWDVLEIKVIVNTSSDKLMLSYAIAHRQNTNLIASISEFDR